METPPVKGNNPERWNKLLDCLDDKLQLGLLNQLRTVASYHFEEDILYIMCSSQEQYDYLKKDAFFQQLELLAQDTIEVDKVKVKLATTSET